MFYWISDCWEEQRNTLFFLHGLTADHTMFEKQVEYFEKDFNLILWDAPEHGKSRPYTQFSYPNAVEDLKLILEENSVREVVMIGQSLGGYFAQTFILRYPEMVKGFIGIGYAGFLEDNRDIHISCPVLIILGDQDKTGKVKQYCKAWSEATGYPLQTIKNAAHNANVDNWIEVNSAIEKFLK